MLSVRQAQARILAKVHRLPEERVDTVSAFGRVLASPVIAKRDLPPVDNSAMDGYAVRAVDVPNADAELPVRGIVAAGDRPGLHLEAQSAVAIMTGAPLPHGADAVILREDAIAQGDRVRFSEVARVGQHVRRSGEDVSVGQEVIAAGSRLGPGELAMLASQGLATVAVIRRPRVSIVCTGSELCPLGQEPEAGQIISSNEHALAAQVEAAGGVIVRRTLVGDELAAIEAALADALADSDVVVSSGGVSVGDFDHVREALGAVGVATDFWKVAMRPGKPMVFGTSRAGAPLFGLPGNPVSSMVSFELFVRPALLALQGARVLYRPRIQVSLASPVSKRPGRTLFVRAALDTTGAQVLAHPHSKQGSGMLSSLVGVDALVEIDADQGDQAAGAVLPAILTRWS